MKIGIVGGGPAGLFFALHMKKNDQPGCSLFGLTTDKLEGEGKNTSISRFTGRL